MTSFADVARWGKFSNLRKLSLNLVDCGCGHGYLQDMSHWCSLIGESCPDLRRLSLRNVDLTKLDSVLRNCLSLQYLSLGFSNCYERSLPSGVLDEVLNSNLTQLELNGLNHAIVPVLLNAIQPPNDPKKPRLDIIMDRRISASVSEYDRQELLDRVGVRCFERVDDDVLFWKEQRKVRKLLDSG